MMDWLKCITKMSRVHIPLCSSTIILRPNALWHSEHSQDLATNHFNGALTSIKGNLSLFNYCVILASEMLSFNGDGRM